MVTHVWTESWKSHEHTKLVLGIARVLCDRISSEQLRVELRRSIDSEDFQSLIAYNLSYDTISVSDAIAARQVLALFSKDQSLADLKKLEDDAWKKFRVAESQCALTNKTFQLWSRGEFQFSPPVEAVFHSAQRKISKVLGDVPSFEELSLRFGPGATTTTKKKDASPRYKLGEHPCFSEDALPVANLAMRQVPHLPHAGLAVSTGRLVFVPKSAAALRAIVVEPAMNTMYQHGYGTFIAERLKTYAHVDITDQSLNQRLARYGSISGALATLDLSSASDTISRELVWHLLPYDWACALSYWVTTRVAYRGLTLRQEKFSSMGNGFTFPLETLLFWALAEAACEVSGCSTFFCNAYGDDIVIPTQASPLLSGVLRAAGFTVNVSKSFAVGRFRESCGADYLDGIDIRPVYIRDRMSFKSLFVIRNFFFRNYDKEIVDIIDNTIPESLRLHGPQGYGDGHLWSSDPPLKRVNREKGYCGYTFDTFSLRSPRSFRPSPGDYVFPLYSIYAGMSKDTPHIHDSRGRLGVVVPGSANYKRISIYTLA